MLTEYLLEWSVSNIIGFVLLFLCWKFPKYGWFGYAGIFLIASVVNMLTALYGPQSYLEYRHFATLDIYQDFIEGFFSRHIVEVVVPIAIGQFLISVGLLYGKPLYRSALLGGMIFSIAIVPLGIGSGMPFPISMFLALWLLYSKRGVSKGGPAVG